MTKDELMTIAAVRYCLGRSSYIAPECCEWLMLKLKSMSREAIRVIARDILEALARDQCGYWTTKWADVVTTAWLMIPTEDRAWVRSEVLATTGVWPEWAAGLQD